MDQAERIIQELVGVCEAIGHPVELDRRYPVAENECPRLVVRTGEEELAPPDTSKKAVWDRRWIMRPTVEVYLYETDPVAQRVENNRIWSEFRAQFRDAGIVGMLANGALPEMKRTVLDPDESSAISGSLIELGLLFDRS